MSDSPIRPPVASTTPKATKSSSTPTVVAPPAPTPTPASAPVVTAPRDAYLGKKAKSLVSLGLPDPIARVIDLLKGDGPQEKEGPRLRGLDRGWVPQGQAHDQQRGEILTSYYADVDGVEHGHLGIMSKDGQEKHHVALGGYGTGGGAEGPSHSGGVATEGELVYVSDTEGIYAYRREDIDNARVGEEVQAVSFSPTPGLDEGNPDHDDLVSSGATVAVKDGYAYVAGYSKDEDGKTGAVWRFRVDPETGGMLQGTLQGPIKGPDRIQGITVTEDGLLFTTGDQKLFHQTVDFDTFAARKPVPVGDIDGYAQGLSIVDGEVWITYESGAEKYADDARGKGFGVREHIQRIPLEALDLDESSTSGGGSW